ncbi:MAG: nucleotidyltransferase domain-containing protein [Chloroflexi bacterium]|nr:nucleotidyltransferase domain-containing protein [Chloroflexota bacterium]MBU1751311.1 nucleotidyltransferase domain-containing protein [Chloroflexota bacterium]MBU1877628.1 nucleotidyltransferase domain-containing protein [Chloroflexota bacterium]
MIRILDFEPELAAMLPATYALLKTANLTVHPNVSRIILHGSRGLAASYRPNSDIDLSLIVDTLPQASQLDIEFLLHSIFETTQSTWQAAIEPDLAIIFETRDCALKCFGHTAWHEHICTIGGVDCFGLYKVQKGFNGLVTNAGIQIELMYPCLQIWRRT